MRILDVETKLFFSLHGDEKSLTSRAPGTRKFNKDAVNALAETRAKREPLSNLPCGKRETQKQPKKCESIQGRKPAGAAKKARLRTVRSGIAEGHATNVSFHSWSCLPWRSTPFGRPHRGMVVERHLPELAQTGGITPRDACEFYSRNPGARSAKWCLPPRSTSL